MDLNNEQDLYNILPNPDRFDDADYDLILQFPCTNYFSVEDDLNRIYPSTPMNQLLLLHYNITSEVSPRTLNY